MRATMLATVAGLGLAGAALAQGKPSAPGAAQQALPTAKPPPLGAPAQAQPAPRPAPQQVQPAPLRPPMVPPQQQAAPQRAPANEPAAVARFRSLLGPGVRLTYGNAQALDAAGEQVRMSGVVLEREGKRATADEVTLNGLRNDGVAEAVIRGFATTEDGTQVRVAMVRIAGLTVPRDGSGAPPQPEQVRLESLRVEGVETSGAATVRLATASFENWVAGQPARFSLEGLEVSRIEDAGMVDAVRLARFAFSGVDIASLMGAVIRQDRPSSLVGRAAMEMDGLELAGGGRPVGRMTEMRIAADVTKPDGSGTGTLAFRGIRVEATPIIAAWLTRFGYQAIDADITSATAYDGGSGRIEVGDISLAVREAGTLSLAVTLDGLTQERLQANEFDAARLISFAVRYADASLFQRFIAAQARESRTPEPQLREQMAAMAGGALSQPGAQGLDPVRDAVQRFIRGQARTIEIRANPPQPLGMADAQRVPPNPVEAQRRLGITATAQ
jgi:hypothetical protein